MDEIQKQSHELGTRDEDVSNVKSLNSSKICKTNIIPDVSLLSISENGVFNCDESESNLSCHKIVASSPSSQNMPSCSSLDLNISNCSKGLKQSDDVEYICYKNEQQMKDIMHLIQKDLSEPYSIYTYRYFIHNWPKLCFLAMDRGKCVGAIVCKLDVHRKVRRGYIAMLAVDENYRKKHIGSNLVLNAIEAMVNDGADEVVLETEITNKPALRLYENLGFVRDKRLFCYYLNGVDALRLKLWLK
ncbi:N-alpha-acetyltransferase 30-like [Daktulosphaira vitifoliae]|uniref:N-alpha-acetyltransferase 30-like n=1 Tax=Daktulosphaira vitifoliae TaxID=58002 RepID=UPI0021AA0FB6|nr:N-alpha-acetyltransferase 30-like [Daktulosphaira vitifoliae]